MDWKALLKTWVLLVVGVFFASVTSPGIVFDDMGSLFLAALLLSLINLFIKPLLFLFSLPFIILTFGIGIWLINAVLFTFVEYLVEGFHVAGFLNAMWGALVLGITHFIGTLLFGDPVKRPQGGGFRVDVRRGVGQGPVSRRGRRRSELDDDDVIDV